MESPLTRRVDFGLREDRCSGGNADRVLDRVPLALACIEDRPHAVQVHRVGHHGLVDELEADPLAILQADWLRVGIFDAVDRPDITLHVSGQAQLDLAGCVAVGIEWLLGPQIVVGEELAAVCRCRCKAAA